MHKPLLIILIAVVLLAISTLALMNNSCKSTQHGWCAPMATVRHHIKAEHS
jgi:hypothetical protein